MTKFSLPQFEGKDVVFIGHGREGHSFETFIQSYGNIRSFRFVDKQDGPNYLENLKKLDLNTTVVVKTSGCPGRLVPVPYLTSTQIFFDLAAQLGAKVIGITGTKGKTTTTALTTAILQKAGLPVVTAGNMGSPMIEALAGANSQTIFVLELSSYMLSELTVSPHIAAVTNLYHDHIDYHGSLEAYYEAKHHITSYQTEQDCFIYNPDFEPVGAWAAKTKAKAVAIDPQEAVDMSPTKLIGDHNRLNYLIAREIARQCHVTDEISLQALHEFTPVEHRLQTIAVINDATYIDDAIASQPEAAMAGIEAVGNEVGQISVLLLGGKDRDYDFHALLATAARFKIPYLVLFPETQAKMQQSLPADYQPELFETNDMQAAVTWAASKAQPNSVVLLSTGAPSYSVWQDYKAKGDAFQAAVKSLQKP